MSIKPVADRELLLDRVILVALAGVILVVWLTRPAPPNVQLVNGTYSNACCEPIRLQDGVIIAGGQRVPFKLLRTKDGGLVADPARILEVRGGNEVLIRYLDAGDPFDIYFDQDPFALTIWGEKRGLMPTDKYVFMRN